MQYKISKEKLEELYTRQKLTRKKIALMFGLSEGLVKYYMKQYGIQARSRHSYLRTQEATTQASQKIWRGCGDVSMTYFNQVKSGANRHGKKLQFTITIEDIWTLFQKQGSKCALTGLPIQLAKAGEVCKKSTVQTASLDRIDSSLGYVVDNIQWVHKDVQKMKMDLPEDRFVELCRLVSRIKDKPCNPHG